MRRVPAVVLAALAVCPRPAAALDVAALEASVTDHRFRVRLEAVVAAPVDRVARVLTDYAGYASLDPRIRTSEILSSTGAGQARIRTSIRACAAFFCRTVRRTEQVTQRGDRLVATVVPDGSDVRYGVTVTQWRGDPGGTRIWYQSEFEPGFWVPEIVARRYAAASLRDSARRLFENVEAKARVR